MIDDPEEKKDVKIRTLSAATATPITACTICPMRRTRNKSGVYYQDHAFSCSLTDNKIPDVNTIPDWCPLPTYQSPEFTAQAPLKSETSEQKGCVIPNKTIELRVWSSGEDRIEKGTGTMGGDRNQGNGSITCLCGNTFTLRRDRATVSCTGCGISIKVDQFDITSLVVQIGYPLPHDDPIVFIVGEDGYTGKVGATAETVDPTETINHPSHYTPGIWEVYKVLEAWEISNPYVWNAIKYLARAAKKGRYEEDLKKAAWYLNREIQRMEEPT